MREQLGTFAAMLGRQFPKVQAMLEAAQEELLAFTAFPVGHWKKIWSTDEIVNPFRWMSSVVALGPCSSAFAVAA